MIQLDGALPYYARIVKNFLNTRYNGMWIGRGGPIAWPVQSPDLTSPNFYLWSYLKNSVYEREPTTRDDMIQRKLLVQAYHELYYYKLLAILIKNRVFKKMEIYLNIFCNMFIKNRERQVDMQIKHPES